MDGIKMSDVTLEDLELTYKSDILLKLAVPEETKHVGGLTIFGKNFGNYNQGISVRLVYNTLTQES
jgi:predicted transcriptional regulator